MKKLRITYLTPYDLLRPRTNQVSDVRLCEGFSLNGCEVSLYTPVIIRPDNLPADDILTFYGCIVPLQIHPVLPALKSENPGKKAYLRLAWRYFREWQKKRSEGQHWVVSRSEILLLFFVLFKPKGVQVVPWLHELKRKPLQRFVLRRADFVLATNSSILRDLDQWIGISEQRSAITINPVNQQAIRSRLDRSEARKRIDYHSEKPLVVYTGKLYINQPEIALILKAARQMPDVNFLFTGGKKEVVAHYQQQENSANLLFTGYLPDHRMIAPYQAAADLLLSYYTQAEHDVRYNLPNKLAEYMASGTAIATPFHPATADLLTDDRAFRLTPENPDKLVEELQNILNDQPERERLANEALRFATVHDNREMCRRILSKWTHD